MKCLLAALCGMLLSAGGQAAVGSIPCTSKLPVGAVCEAALAALQPTQFGVGMLQVSDEMRKLERKSPVALRETVIKKCIAVVIGPDGGLWLVDRHHFARALWELGEHRARVSIVGHIDQHDDFWQVMQAEKWVWLFDERGNPREPADLPRQIKDLPDYSYRSLAGFAEDEHFFSKPGQIYFIEFAWARYFGDQLGWVPVTAENIDQRLDQARRIACQPAAAGLPGYPGAACQKSKSSKHAERLKQ